jgi:hypothetical protein
MIVLVSLSLYLLLGIFVSSVFTHGNTIPVGKEVKSCCDYKKEG